MKENLIVTGGLGFIGSNLIKLLLKKKFSVINIDNVSYSSNFYNIKDLPKKITNLLNVTLIIKKNLLIFLKNISPLVS